jgi:hypothetical protein
MGRDEERHPWYAGSKVAQKMNWIQGTIMIVALVNDAQPRDLKSFHKVYESNKTRCNSDTNPRCVPLAGYGYN